MLYKIKENLMKLCSNRFVILSMIFLALAGILVYRLFILQIVEGKEHLENFIYKSKKTINVSSARGNIMDRNGEILAYNKLAYSLTFENTDEIAKRARENGTDESTELNRVIYNLIQLLEENKDQMINDFPIVYKNGRFQYTLENSARNRFIAEVYGTSSSQLTKKQKAATAEEIYLYLRHGDGKKTKKFNIDDSYSDEEALQIMSVRYALYLNRFTQYSPTTIARNISEESLANIKERQDEFPGAQIVADSLRVYNDSKYFSPIIGYIGIISQEELENYNEEIKKNNSKQEEYVSTDVTGKAGIEKEMEAYLQGTKGEETVFVDNMGKILEVTNSKDPVAGNDVYLTFDKDLQIYAYDALEKQIAGIVYNHLTSGTSRGTKKNYLLPIHEVYFSLIDNNVIDATHFSHKNASDTERSVYSAFQSKKSSVLTQIKGQLVSTQTPMQYLDDEYNDYMNYIYSMLSDQNIIKRDHVNKTDDMFVKWKNEKISLTEFFKYAIKNNWIDISNFDISNDYYGTDEIFNELVKYTMSQLKDDTDFDKIIYKYMIKSNSISGKQLCLILYDQNVLNAKKDKEDYEKLQRGQISAYEFMKLKIKKLEITPAQLALDPCSGSVIVTDVNTGQVLALATYPSYDNNRLTNSIDSDYYSQLLNDKSLPLLNRAMQSKTAPGSTFKMISSVAGLEENVISTGSVIYDKGIYDTVSPPAKCWVYPSAHGALAVDGAIEVSCNSFFYEVGYRLGKDSTGKYNSVIGLEKIRKYASMFGLNRTSGIELTESEPQISDDDAVRSAIGQGTHNYTPSQLARYVTTVANNGDCYDLTIIDKVVDNNGKEILNKTPESSKVEIKESTWTAIHNGMFRVVNGSKGSQRANFSDIREKGLEVAGKTGTAQEDKSRPNHGLFVSYAPYDKPEIAVTVVIPYGYSSSNAATLAKEIYKYYFKLNDNEENENDNHAFVSGANGTGGD